MNTDVADEVRALRDMTIRELQQMWLELFGEATRTGNRQYLIKRLAWRIQANAEGDISERARQRAEELANEADLRLRPPRERQPRAVPGQTLRLSPRGPDLANRPLSNATQTANIKRPFFG